VCYIFFVGRSIVFEFVVIIEWLIVIVWRCIVVELVVIVECLIVIVWRRLVIDIQFGGEFFINFCRHFVIKRVVLIKCVIVIGCKQLWEHCFEFLRICVSELKRRNDSA
jgi:hypothetical protein